MLLYLFTESILFYQLSYIVFFLVCILTTYLFWVRNDTQYKVIEKQNSKWEPILIRQNITPSLFEHSFEDLSMVMVRAISLTPIFSLQNPNLRYGRLLVNISVTITMVG